MFTGIITDIGKVTEVRNSGNGIRLVLKVNNSTEDVDMGASISCNGCCLTVVEKTADTVSFDLSNETLERTDYRNIKTGNEINIERAMKAGDEFGGHMVTGHVDCLAEVVSVEELQDNRKIKLRVPAAYIKYIVPKGSVTLNGVSLTINAVEKEIFEVNIIPHTLQNTNLKHLRAGDSLNLEIDMIARYLEKLVR